MILSLSARVSPCFILILFLSKHFMAYLTFKRHKLHINSHGMILPFTAFIPIFPYIFPVSAFLQPYTSPKPPLPMIRCTLKSFMVSWGRVKVHRYFNRRRRRSVLHPNLKSDTFSFVDWFISGWCESCPSTSTATEYPEKETPGQEKKCSHIVCLGLMPLLL